MKNLDTKKCLLCHKDKGRIKSNQTLYWHSDPESGEVWVYCTGVCGRGYSIYDYCYKAGLSVREFLQNDFHFQEATPNEVNKVPWPRHFIPMSNPNAKAGLDYIRSRALEPDNDIFYDSRRSGIVFPYYYSNTFVGAQIRFISPFIDKDGNTRKIDTMPGTRLGLLFYGWNQESMHNIRGFIVCEGAFNALSIQQSLNKMYGSALKNPWKAIATSGSGLSQHHIASMKNALMQGKRVVIAPDSDDAGIKMYRKALEANAISHFCFTDHPKKDWNDFLQQLGSKQFTKFFLGNITDV